MLQGLPGLWCGRGGKKNTKGEVGGDRRRGLHQRESGRWKFISVNDKGKNRNESHGIPVRPNQGGRGFELFGDCLLGHLEQLPKT